uniref:CC domain-containing protein n=1 Tax=Steinernema glaseri TaxID=37863 RepID=A0A1I8A093_9BILA
MCRTTVLLCLVAVALSLSSAEETKSVAKRQTYYWYYYICGTYPYQWTSYYPCNYYNPQPQPQPQPTYCNNGGTTIGRSCYNSYECSNYQYGTECINGQCCTGGSYYPTTAPPTTLPPACNYYHPQPQPSYCSNGGTSLSRSCYNSYQCNNYRSGAVCINGRCCTGSNYPTRSPATEVLLLAEAVTTAISATITDLEPYALTVGVALEVTILHVLQLPCAEVGKPTKATV